MRTAFTRIVVRRRSDSEVSRTMMLSVEESIELLADGLALVYHEARHVKHLIKAGFLAKEGWERLTNLPANRILAWKVIQPQRQQAARAGSAPAAMAIFTRAFLKDLDDISVLYADSHWKHAASVGGHAWQGVARAVHDLAEALDAASLPAIFSSSQTLLQARHNNGCIRHKIAELDEVIEVTTHPAWFERTVGVCQLDEGGPVG